jgi:hypothetical protein
MPAEDPSIAIWLPLEPEELAFLQTSLRDAGVLVPGNYAGENPYQLVDYLVAGIAEDGAFRALFDRNLISPLVSLASGAMVPASEQAEHNARLASACACFCILANILIEPNIALYEFASTAGNVAAQSDARLFRVADNSDAMAYLDIALGRTDSLSQDLLSRVRGLPEVAEDKVQELNFERLLRMWKPNYLYALKAVVLRRSGLSPLEAAMELTRWQADEAFFNAAGAMYCLAAISHKPPKGGMLKSLMSENLSAVKAGVRNATWDMCLLQQFGTLVRKPSGTRWSLWSTDVAVREVAKSLFARDNEVNRDKLRVFYERHWGNVDGRRLQSAYEAASARALVDPDARDAKIAMVFNKIDEHIIELEAQLSICDA